MAQRRSRRRNAEYNAAEDLHINSEAYSRKRNIRTRRRKERKIKTFLAALVVLLLCVGIAGIFIYQKYSPSKEQKDLNEWFEVSGNEVKVHLNDSRADILGLYENGTVYLPISWVTENINKRFYWNEAEELLTYTLPDEIKDMDSESTDDEGLPVFIIGDSGMLLGINTIEKYTDIRVGDFSGDEETAKRIFIYTENGPYKRAEVKKDTAIRTKGGIKSPVLAELLKGDCVNILEDMGDWSKVSSEKGFVGYVKNNRLSEPYDYTYESDFEEPVFEQNSIGEKVVLAWHFVSGSAGNVTFDEYYANTKGLNVICPTWIQFKDNEGNYDNFTTQEYIDKAHAAGLQVWVMADNFNSPTGRTEFKTKDVFSNTEKRRRVIDNLINDAVTYGYDGLNLDFESLPTDAGVHYVQFFRELSVACRREGIILSIDNYVPFNFNDHYELDEQADFADYVIIMGYDEHTAGSEEAGSVASIGYVRSGIEKTLEEVPKERVINAVPFYTRVWEKSGPNLSSRALGMKDAADYVENEGIELAWDDETGQYYGKKVTDTVTLEIWQEDARSIRLKVDAIKEYGLAGVGAWRLGYEPSEIWDEMQLN